MNDLKYMEMAIDIAKRGEGHTNPNPMVGAVIVKNGIVIGKGYHEKYGFAHAERNALANCIESPEGATMYVTLEPCCHYGKTPPCTEVIIENKIAKVVIGNIDNNQLVSGQGVNILKKAGIEVKVGILEQECRNINKIFFHYMKEKTPFIAMKYAMTLDGKIASYSGKSKWITDDIAREHVHSLRHKYMAIMVGIGTVLKDNPRLDCRIPNGRNPIRIICDTNLRIPFDCNIAQTAKQIETYIATSEDNERECNPARKDKEEKLREMGFKIVKVPKRNEHIDLTKLKFILGDKGIDSVLLEGGGTLNYQALQSEIVDYLYAYIAPKILGGENAISPVEGEGRENPDIAFKFKQQDVKNLGDDILIEYEAITT